MDVPFLSSGATSRAHYALVRKVETAQNIQAADQYIWAEVNSIRDQLSQSTLSLRQCKECLILLLWTNVHASNGLDIQFALSHAVSLAESGRSIQDKRIGYLFCAEIMSPEHELQLMLVNTVRKDLESDTIPSICLALDALIQFSTEDVIPAIRSRLVELLSHTSPHVRRRALLAFHRLSGLDRDILNGIAGKVRRRLTDSELAVINAAIRLRIDLVNAGHVQSAKTQSELSRLLTAIWRSRTHPGRNSTVIRILCAMQPNRLSPDDLHIIFEIIRESSQLDPSPNAVIYQGFVALSHAPPQSILSMQVSSKTSIAESIRKLLTSNKPNDTYLFLSCLECLDPQLWAGTNPDIAAVLDGWEVERIMKLLDSNDQSIRRKTMRILHRVDHVILDMYYSRLLQGDIQTAESLETDEVARRLLEVVEVISSTDGELYAQHIKNALGALGVNNPLNQPIVMDSAVEDVLVRVRNGDTSFQSGCIGNLFADLIESEVQIGPTLMVILIALVAEYLRLAPMSPISLLRGLSERIASYPASIQDASLLCMIRIAAECDQIPSDVTESIRLLHEKSGRHLRRRCDQFLSLSMHREILKDVVSSTQPSSLPDFLLALESHMSEKRGSLSLTPSRLSTRSPEHSLSQNSNGSHRLRYDAYDPPKQVRRLRRYSSSSRVSDDGSSRFVGQSRTSQDALSETITPGDLALAMPEDLETISTGSPPPDKPALPVVQIIDESDSATRVDLIALDSPFVPEPLPTKPDISHTSDVDLDFERAWNELEQFSLRGWSDIGIDAVVRRLQGMQRSLRVISDDQEPYEGELKVQISSFATLSEAALLRLKASEDQSCLWRLRCQDEALRTTIKGLLS